MFFLSKDDEILNGLTTDIYFKRTEEILRKRNIKKEVWAEFTAPSLPYSYAVFAGLTEVVELLKNKPIDLWTIPEGTIFKGNDKNGIPVPVMAISGDYKEFAIFETPLLGFICQASGITTKAARLRKSAKDATLLSFGIRRMHPGIAPFIDYYAYLGGVDGVSSVIGAKAIGQVPKGTMPHSLIITMGEENAWRAFDEEIPEDVPRIALIDTYGDEKTTAIKAIEIVKNLSGIRLDTPSSRKGNFPRIVQEVRWELDIRGAKNIQIFISGGLDENSIEELYKAGARGFGIGTNLANAKVIDYAMDIVEIQGKPCAKKGKFGARKKVLRCENCSELYIYPFDEQKNIKCEECGEKLQIWFEKIIENGKIIKELPPLEKRREFILSQLDKF